MKIDNFSPLYLALLSLFCTNFLTVSNFGGCGGLERTDFYQFLLWAGVVVLNEQVFNIFYFGQAWWS